MTKIVNPEQISELLRECAREHITPYFRNLSEDDVQYKNDKSKSKVTIADHKSEAFLTAKLTALLPNSLVVGEEGVHENKSVLDYLQDSEKLIWVIDPIDGTHNFSSGSEVFCVMLALVKNGETQMAWIYDVCNDSMTFAEKGKGTFIDGVQIFIDQTTPLEGSKGFAGYKFVRQVENITINTLRCAGHEYLRILKNEAVFALYSFMNPWDHAAGTFMVEEAGGYVAKWDGSAYSSRETKGGIIAANSQETWQKVKDAIPHEILQKHVEKP